MGKVLYIPLRLTRRVNVSAVVSIYKHLTLYSLNYPRRGCRFLQPGPSGFVLEGSAFSGMPNLKTLRVELLLPEQHPAFRLLRPDTGTGLPVWITGQLPCHARATGCRGVGLIATTSTTWPSVAGARNKAGLDFSQ